MDRNLYPPKLQKEINRILLVAWVLVGLNISFAIFYSSFVFTNTKVGEILRKDWVFFAVIIYASLSLGFIWLWRINVEKKIDKFKQEF